MKLPGSLQKTLTWSMIGIAVLSFSLIGGFWVMQELYKFEADSDRLKEQYIENQKDLIKTEVDRVVDYIRYQRATTEKALRADIQSRVEEAIAIATRLHDRYQGIRGESDIKALITETLRAIRFNNGRGYFFIYDMEGNNILLPFYPDLEGQNLWDLQDSKGQYTVRRFIGMMRSQGEGFLRWHWYKPGESGRMSEKIGFSKLFRPYSWWIGTGEYIEDVEKEIQAQTLERINSIRYGQDGYIFAYDFHANTLAHYKPENIGINQWEFRDPSGIPVLQELIRLSHQKEGGYLEYVGTIRPSTGEPARKIGYARAIEDWGWMVGTGSYIDSINQLIAERRVALTNKMLATLTLTGLVLLLAFLIIALLSRRISAKISGNIALFSTFFTQAASGTSTIDDQAVHFEEFKQLADGANAMVAERDRIASSLAEVQQQLDRSRKMEALGVLAGGVAHDLNNVLAAIVGYPDLLLIHLAKDDPHRRYIEAIRESGLKASEIVQDLLAMARRGVLQTAVLNLNNLIETYLASPEHVQVLTANPGIRIEIELADDLLPLRGSQVHLLKTIMNLISNAAEAQPHGGIISISTENRYLDHPVSGYEQVVEGDYVTLTVRDQGTGISASDLEHIFEPFFTKKKLGRSGTGLGMAVVWGSVQDHGGYIEVTTADGEGARFDLYFPATREQLTSDAQAPEPMAFQGKGEMILLVDDLPEQRDVAGSILENLGYRVSTAASGEEALEILAKEPADLLLLDMIMHPGMDGLDTYRQALALNPHQRAVIVSGYAETHRVKAALDLGVARYVKKPYTMQTLAQAVREALQAEPPKH